MNVCQYGRSFSCPHCGVPCAAVHEELGVGDDPRVAGQHVDDPGRAAALGGEDDESRHGREILVARVGFRAVKAKRVLVTGGAGFIPSNFVRHILEATPYEVVSLDALTYAGSMDNLASVSGHERHSFVHGDIRDPELVRQVVAEVDVIVNAAAESHVEKSIESGRLRVRDDERRGHADPARRDSGDAGRALHPLLVERGLRDGRSTRPWTRSTRSTRGARTRRRRPAPTGSPTRTTSRTGCRS